MADIDNIHECGCVHRAKVYSAFQNTNQSKLYSFEFNLPSLFFKKKKSYNPKIFFGFSFRIKLISS